MTARGLEFRSELCSGCGYCELACSVGRKGVAAPSKALVRLRQDYRFMERHLFYCQQCEEPECIGLCPTGAIDRDSQSGLIYVDSEQCTGCRLCLACSRGGMFFDEESGLAEQCDLCQGNPNCVVLCPKGALTFQRAERGQS